jgi:hypothetical protein
MKRKEDVWHENAVNTGETVLYQRNSAITVVV